MQTSEHVELKLSAYNIVINGSDNVAIVYNTLQDSITLMKGRTQSKGDICALHLQGVLCNKNIDERHVFRHRMNLQKYSNKILHMFITLTGLCNCECRYCFAKNSFPACSIGVEDTEYIVSFAEGQLNMRHIESIVVDFFGGEPMLCREICLNIMEKLNTLADKYGATIEFRVYTNGTVNPFKNPEDIVAFSGVRFLITLDGLKEEHDYLRPMKSAKSSFDLIINNLLCIKENGGQAVIRINFGEKNYKRIPLLLDFLKEKGLTCFDIEFYPIQNMSLGSADYKDAVEPSKLPEMNIFLWHEAWNRGIKVALRPVSSCCYCTAFTSSMFVIDPELNVYKCALLQCDRKYSIGSLKRNTDYQRDLVFYDWINYDPSSEEKCKDCKSLPVCAGGCGGSGTFRFGSIHHENCYDLSEAMLKERIRLYVMQYYSGLLRQFQANDSSVLILERAKHPAL